MYQNVAGLQTTLEVALGKLNAKDRRITRLETVLRELLFQIDEERVPRSSQYLRDAINEAFWALNSPPDPKPVEPKPPPAPKPPDDEDDDEI